MIKLCSFRWVSCALLFAAAVAGSVWGQTVNLQKKRSLPDFDSRLQAASLEAPAVVRQNLAKEIVARRIADVESFVVSEQVARPGTRIVVSRQGLPQLYLRDGHALSAPSTREPEEIAKAFLREHAAVFPFAPGEVDQLSLTVKDVTQDATYLAFMQTLDGVPVFEGQIKFTLSAAGEVIQVGCGDVMPGLNLSTKPALSPDEAAEKAGASVGGKGTLSRAPELVIFPLDASTARLAWRVFMDVDPDGSHEILVDAEDGRLLYRHSLQVFDGAQCAQGQTPGACVWTKSPMQSARAWVPFPAGWIPVGGSVTTGNNADAYLDADGNDSPDNVNTAGMQIGRAYSPTQAFNFTFGDGTLGLDPRNYQAAAVTNLFYFLNMAHDHYYGLGFTEAAGNFQTDNFGRGGVGNDAVLGEAQYGGFTDNSSFSPKPDGTAPRLSMGLYTRSTSSHTDDLDADYAGQTAFHEYGHGVSNRLVGARVNMSCLYQVQSGAMGEGWSDYFAISYYNDPVYGYYQTQNATHGLRRQSYEGYTFTYEDIGNGANGYEVHDDGEIWAATLWDLRKSLGQAVTDQLVMNGLKSTPCNPSMTDARDAILSADQAANGGANRASIWAVFARHGMGYSASGSDGGVITGTVYNAAYDQPPDLQAARNPAITSTPPGVVGLGDSYSYPVTASNPNNGVLSFALSSGPAGMTIDSATGAIRWTAGFTGPQRVKVTVTDGKGGKVVHGYLLPVMTRLTAGAPMVISGTTGSAGLAYLDVPAGVPVLQVTLRGSTGDADLAVLDPDGHFAVSVRVGSTETLSFANPAQGLWEIEVDGYMAYSGVSLMAALVTPAPLAVNATLTGLSGVLGSETLYRITIPSGTAAFSVSTSGGAGDVDLYLRQGKPAVCQVALFAVVETCLYDLKSFNYGNADTITVTSPAVGDWYLDLSGYAAYSGVTLTTSTPGTLSITTPSPLPSGSAGAAYSQSLAASGGVPPYTWSITSGALPVGLALSSAGVIAGTPTTAGNYSFTVRVADSASAAATQTFSLTISGLPPTITTSSTLPSGFTGWTYSQTLAAAGGVPPYTWSITSGALPAGLALSSAGVIAGTPTAAGNYSFTVRVTDSASAAATQPFSLTVAAAPSLVRAGTLSHIAAGGDWDTTISLITTSSAPVAVRLVFHADDGSALSLPLSVTQQGVTQSVTTATLDRVINPKTTLVIDAGPGLASLVWGWADVLSSGAVSGFAIFRTKCPTCTASEGTVPLQSSFQSTLIVPYDNTANFVTGVALANLSATQASITATIWDENGSQLGAPTIIVAGSGHTAFVMPTGLPLTSGKRGIVQFRNPSGGALDGLGLRFSPFGTFTSVPTILQTAIAVGPLVRAGTLSHIAAGGDWVTTISLINTSSAPVAARLVFHADDGSALSLPLSVTQQGATQSVTAATLDRVINPNTTLVIDAGPGLASLVWGWADVLSTGPLSGFAIFRTKCPTCTASEGTVPLQSSFQSTLIVPYDNTANFVTGVALANLSATQASITATIWDENGSQLGAPTITVAGSGHTAFVMPTGLPLTTGKRGIVQFQNPSGGALDGLGLRFSPFGTFTSVPTILQAPVLQITSLNPASGQAGSTVALAINGANLSGVTAVQFSPSTGITVSNVNATATQVTATVIIAASATAGQRNVSVSSPAGTSNSLAFAIQTPPQTYDGQWYGTTSQGRDVSMTIAGNSLTAYYYGINFPDLGPSCYTGVTVTSLPGISIPITGSSFSTTASSSVFFGTFSGTFQSLTQASGSLSWTLSLSGCNASGTLTWSATKQ